jgi:hypothetical protein
MSATAQYAATKEGIEATFILNPATCLIRNAGRMIFQRVPMATPNPPKSKTLATDLLKSTADGWTGGFMKGGLQMEQIKPPAFIPQGESRIRWLKSLQSATVDVIFGRYSNSTIKPPAHYYAAVFISSRRAGIGKTAFLFSLAYRQALAGLKICFCNLEMSVEAMWHRLACLHDPDLTLRELNEGERTMERAAYFTALSAELEKFSPLFFESTDVAAMLAAAHSEIQKSSDTILFIDYVGLLTMRSLGPDQRYWLVSETAKQLIKATRP